MIEVRATEYLAEIEGVPVVVKLVEHYLFGKFKIKTEELHSYNNALIQAFTPNQVAKKSEPIGFKSNKTKKRKKHENKSKTDKSKL